MAAYGAWPLNRGSTVVSFDCSREKEDFAQRGKFRQVENSLNNVENMQP